MMINVLNGLLSALSGDDEGEPLQIDPLALRRVPGAAQGGARPLPRHGLQGQPVRPGDGAHALQTGTSLSAARVCGL